MNALLATLEHGPLDVAGALILLVLGVGASILGGIVGGILVGGKDLGAALAGMMGGFFGPVASVPAFILALAALMLV